MGLTDRQMERRKHSLGASDVAAVMGVDPRRNAYDCFLEKTGKLVPLVENKAMDAGKRFEDAVLEWASESLGKIRRNVFVVAPNGLPIHANLDAQVVSDKSPVEGKTSGLFGPLMKGWGCPGTDEIPDGYVIQAQVQLLCTEREVCHVPAFLAGRGFEMFKVETSPDLQDIMVTKCVEFWDRYVKRDIPPEDVFPSMESIKRIIRKPLTMRPVPIDKIKAWQDAKEAEKRAEKDKERAEIEMLTMLGDAEGSEIIEGFGQVTYLQTTRETCDSAKLRSDFPDVWEKVKKESKSRTPRFKKEDK